ncbi:tartrate dehydrogenase [candidate division KSB1 bacterium]|nr:tartrate dehydrogenase [candidate division KSB1 bacterium]
MKSYKIAVVPGDGIGKEIIPEGVKVLNAAGEKFGFTTEDTYFPWGAEYYLKTREFMPENGLEILRAFDAIYFGAVGHPSVDDVLPAIKYTFRVRKGFQQYVNYRPVKFIAGVTPAIRNKKAGDVDFVIVRENTEGEFSEVGNIIHPDSPEGMALQISIFTRKGIERIGHYSFKLARSRKKKVTNVTKSNTLIHSLRYWDEILDKISKNYPDVQYEKMYVDNASANFVLHPERFDVIVTTNMIGDILSDLGAAIMGSLGLGASGNINPEKEYPSMFEPIHGSAPDIAGKGIANPISAIWSGALMLDHLGQQEASEAILNAITAVLESGLTPADLGGQAKTDEIGDAVVKHLK